MALEQNALCVCTVMVTCNGRSGKMNLYISITAPCLANCLGHAYLLYSRRVAVSLPAVTFGCVGRAERLGLACVCKVVVKGSDSVSAFGMMSSDMLTGCLGFA